MNHSDEPEFALEPQAEAAVQAAMQQYAAAVRQNVPPAAEFVWRRAARKKRQRTFALAARGVAVLQVVAVLYAIALITYSVHAWLAQPRALTTVLELATGSAAIVLGGVAALLWLGTREPEQPRKTRLPDASS